MKVWVGSHPAISLFVLFYSTLLTLWLLLLWWRPFWLLKVNEPLRQVEGKLTIKISGFELVFPIRHALLVGFFHYHARVLDAWVARYLVKAREGFQNLPTVSERSVHIPLPVELQGRLTDGSLSPAHVQPVFSKNNVCVLIRGEGDNGKTSLACQMDRWAMHADSSERLVKEHPMLPVLIEADFEVFLDTVSARLQSLIDETEPVAEDLLLRLLRRRRLLVIVDHLSEINPATRTAFQPGKDGFPANALIITSRLPEATGRLHTTIKPLRIEGDYISDFMGAYLKQRGKRSLFPDSQYFPMLGRLSTMVGERDITVLLAKLYANLMIAVQEGEATDLPDNIPDLMLTYLNSLNREAGPDDPDNRRVHRLAKPLAWLCLKTTYHPAPVKRDEVQDLLKKAHEDETLLRYFEKKLLLIQTVGPAEDQIQFSLDPLAEYLAALHVVEKNGGNEEDWYQFIDKVASIEGAPEAVKSFLLAVRDCCLRKTYGQQVPLFVPQELARLADLDPEVLKQRVGQLIQDLSLPSAEDRRNAAVALGEIGPAAAPAVKALTEALKDKDAEVRRSAAMALGEIGPEAAPAVEALIEALKDEEAEVRRNATVALGEIGPAAVTLFIEALKDEEAEVRRYAARALGWIGPEAAPAVKALTEALKDKDAGVRRYATGALRRIGPTTNPSP